MLTTYAAAAAAEEDRGWGGIVALLLAPTIYAAIVYGPGWLRAWLDRRAELDDDEDLDDDGDEVLVDERPSWWQRMATVAAGVADALWDRDPHPLPSPTGDADRGEDAQVTALSPEPDSSGDSAVYDDDPYGHPQIVTLADGRRVRAYITTRPAQTAGAVLEGEVIDAVPEEEDRPPLEEWLERQLAASGAGTTAIVAEATARYGASESTIWRTIRRLRASGRLPD